MGKVVELRGGPETGTHRGVPDTHHSITVRRDGTPPQIGWYKPKHEGLLLWHFSGWHTDFNAEAQKKRVSAAERDKGIAKVQKNDPTFSERVQLLVQFVRPGTEVTSDNIRALCEEGGVIPAHPNGWGGSIMGCVRAGLLEDTGKVVRSSRKKSHARRLPVYLRTEK